MWICVYCRDWVPQKTHFCLVRYSCCSVPHSRVSSEGSRKVCEPRVVTVRRAQGAELGLGLCGGNLRGVYVKSLEEDSPARGPEGLQPGDLILEVGYIHQHVGGHTHNVYHNYFMSELFSPCSIPAKAHRCFPCLSLFLYRLPLSSLSLIVHCGVPTWPIFIQRYAGS